METEKSYFYALESSSSKIKIERYGKSTMGKDMILAIFFSGDPDKNVKLIESLTEPLNEIEAKKVASEAKPILFLNCDIHSSEYETTESAMQFAYELLTTYEDLLDDVMVIINPSINPDGHDIYRQWYSMYKNTEYASTSPPNYHAYVDHDLNRDWHEGNTQEIRNLWKVFLKYKPQIFIDNHMMGSKGYRMYIPPERDPVNPEINSLVQIQKYIIGGYIMSELEKSNCTGVVLEEVYDLFYPGYGDSWPSLHNSIGCTWEIARGNGPEPIEIKFESLRDSAKIKNEHQQTPWPGGVWTIEEQIRYRLTGWRALLEITSALGEEILYNYYVMHMDDRSVKGAYIIPFAQKDASVLNKMINKLIDQGVEVRATDEAFIVPKSNPMARVLLGVQELSVPYFYDVTAWNYGMAKGIEIRETDIDVDGKLVEKANISIAKISGHGSYYVFNHTLSGIKLVNDVLKEGNVYLR
jgi:Zinc carboxypeptidase.